MLLGRDAAAALTFSQTFVFQVDKLSFARTIHVGVAVDLSITGGASFFVDNFEAIGVGHLAIVSRKTVGSDARLTPTLAFQIVVLAHARLVGHVALGVWHTGTIDICFAELEQPASWLAEFSGRIVERVLVTSANTATGHCGAVGTIWCALHIGYAGAAKFGR